MIMNPNSFSTLARAALAATPIVDRLIQTHAVVLERLARAGGATKWYCCPDRNHLHALEEQLSPGSVVSFYFDDRIRNEALSPESKEKVESIVSETGEVIVGTLAADGLHVDSEIITGPNELASFFSGVSFTTRIFYGAFPARDNDGIHAVTVTLPDADGIVRPHPH